MTFGTLPRRNPGLAAGATSLESPEFSVRASALTLSVRVYALATRTLPDEVLGSRGRRKGLGFMAQGLKAHLRALGAKR